jgi:hypothetical protein
MNRHVVLFLCVGLVLGGLTINALRSGEIKARLGRIRRAQAPLAFNAAVLLRAVIVLLLLGGAAAGLLGWLPSNLR